MTFRTCSAFRQLDQMRCVRCGLTWDVGDPERPACLSAHDAAMRTIRATLDKSNSVLHNSATNNTKGPK